jgi:hypothetical protein
VRRIEAGLGFAYKLSAAMTASNNDASTSSMGASSVNT